MVKGGVKITFKLYILKNMSTWQENIHCIYLMCFPGLSPSSLIPASSPPLPTTPINLSEFPVSNHGVNMAISCSCIIIPPIYRSSSSSDSPGFLVKPPRKARVNYFDWCKNICCSAHGKQRSDIERKHLILLFFQMLEQNWHFCVSAVSTKWPFIAAKRTWLISAAPRSSSSSSKRSHATEFESVQRIFKHLWL